MADVEALVVRTGVANLASVFAGLARAGARPRLAENAAEIAGAAAVVLPGVGAFGAGMRELAAAGLIESVRERLAAGRPTLAVCLGLQLLFETSEETPGVAGLGVLPGAVGRFAGAVRVPQMGWNRIEPDDGCALTQPGWAYFANSYRVARLPAGWRGGWADYDGRFVATLERGAVLACQFHPELSGVYGLELLRRWLARAAGGRDAGA
jgi:imidazole glycerol phosphate synthase glutamine amidotransferase subunit